MHIDAVNAVKLWAFSLVIFIGTMPTALRDGWAQENKPQNHQGIPCLRQRWGGWELAVTIFFSWPNPSACPSCSSASDGQPLPALQPMSPHPHRLHRSRVGEIPCALLQMKWHLSHKKQPKAAEAPAFQPGQISLMHSSDKGTFQLTAVPQHLLAPPVPCWLQSVQCSLCNGEIQTTLKAPSSFLAAVIFSCSNRTTCQDDPGSVLKRKHSRIYGQSYTKKMPRL